MELIDVILLKATKNSLHDVIQFTKIIHFKNKFSKKITLIDLVLNSELTDLEFSYIFEKDLPFNMLTQIGIGHVSQMKFK